MVRLLISLIGLAAMDGTSAVDGPFSHSALDSVLHQFVDEAGYVDYKALKSNRSDLDRYVQSLADVSPKSHPGRFPVREEKLAYWINAYNALVLSAVLDAYPVGSVKDIKYLSGFFNRTWFTVGGESYTLNGIEHDILRDEFKEPRIHAAINCASVGCPRLRAAAFLPEGLDGQLEKVMFDFLNEARNVTIDQQAGVVRLSKILEWFEADFTGWLAQSEGAENPDIVDYVARYLPEEKSRLLRETDFGIAYYDYDWLLNDQTGHPAQ